MNTATTKRFLPDADALIFVTGFDSALTGAEIEFLADVRRHADKLFIVVNKQDLVPPDDAAEILAYARARLRELFGHEELPVFPVSALHALTARLRGDGALLTRSGLPALETAVLEFLTAEKATAVLRGTAAQAHDSFGGCTAASGSVVSRRRTRTPSPTHCGHGSASWTCGASV